MVDLETGYTVWDDHLVEEVQRATSRAGHSLIVVDADITGLLGSTAADEPPLMLSLEFAESVERDRLEGMVTLSDPSQDGSQRRLVGEAGQVEDLVFRLLYERSDSGRFDAEVQLARTIELFVAEALRDLEDQNSDLRQALEEARIEAGFLRGQLQALREAKAMDRKPLVSAVVGVISGVLLATVTGVSGGASQAVVENRVSHKDDKGSVVEYVEKCREIRDLLDD
jgi:hypothetical protein